MKLFPRPLFMLGACVVFLISACSKGTPPPKRPAPQVSVVTAHAESIPVTRDTVGLLAASRIAEVRARVAGIILKREYTEGTDVHQGQVLFQIDPAELRAALHIQEAALARAKADATNAALIAKRYKGLAAKGLLASQDLDTALSNQRTTAAAVSQAEANLQKAQLDLGYATVTSPIDGHAGKALVTEGALVGQGEATHLTTVEQLDPLYVNFSQSSKEFMQLQQFASTNNSPESTPVDVLLADGTPYAHPGKLDFSALTVDSSTGTVAMRAVIPNPEHKLLPGMFVHLRVTTAHIAQAFRLPQATVLRDSKGAYVMVVSKDGKVEQRRIKTHEMTQKDWIVTGNLAEGDQVILEGLQKVRPGAAATIAPNNPGTKKSPNGKPAAQS